MFRFMNNVRTAMLLAGLMALFLLAGQYIGGNKGMMIAFGIGCVMNFGAYFYSDKLALKSMRAQFVGGPDLPDSESAAPELVAMVRELAEKANLPMPRVYICPQDSPNAFATGRNPNNAAVAVTRGILEILSRDELKGVIGHELAHIKHRDILISSIAATIAGAISMLGYLMWFIPLGGDRRNGNFMVSIAMMILAPIAAGLIQMAISRKREYNADHFGGELAGDPMFLATALERLHITNRQRPMKVLVDSQKSMYIVQPFSGKDAADWFNTHPTLKKRLVALIGRESTGRVGD